MLFLPFVEGPQQILLIKITSTDDFSLILRIHLRVS
jgi:hypothetical protein